MAKRNAPRRKKKQQGSRTTPLVVVAVAIVALIWGTQWLAAHGVGPAWLQFLFAGADTGGLHIAIISGHKGNDTGTVCPDGLTEAEVNLKVAEMVKSGLEREGMRVEILEEFDPKLRGLKASALVSIHSDSCQSDFSGFKVASQEGGTAASERLANCMWDRYEAATGLTRHYATITENMTNYHAFREIALETPAAIIELGFLKSDRQLLTQQPQKAANGIVNGILCFFASPVASGTTPAH